MLAGEGLSLSNHDIILLAELSGCWQQLPEAETKPSRALTFVSFRGVGRGDDVDVGAVHHDLVRCVFHLGEKLHQHQKKWEFSPLIHLKSTSELFEGLGW